MRRTLSTVVPWLLSSALALSAARSARAEIIERVVAVVGEQAILWTELQDRGRPALAQIYERVPQGPQRAMWKDKMYHEVLDKMVDERLIQIAATRGHLSVSPDEIDRGIETVAQGNHKSVEEILSSIQRAGGSITDFRDEIRRQLLEQKVLALRVNPRVRVSSEDIRLTYEKAKRDERQKLPYRLRWIVLHVAPDADTLVKEARRQLAEQIVAQARAGVPFTSLVQQYSDDAPTRKNNGDIGEVKPGELSSSIEDVAMTLGVGDTSNPFLFKGDYVILFLEWRAPSHLPPFAEAQDQIANEVFMERREKAKRQWLDELKRNVYVHTQL